MKTRLCFPNGFLQYHRTVFGMKLLQYLTVLLILEQTLSLSGRWFNYPREIWCQCLVQLATHQTPQVPFTLEYFIQKWKNLTRLGTGQRLRRHAAIGYFVRCINQKAIHTAIDGRTHVWAEAQGPHQNSQFLDVIYFTKYLINVAHNYTK